MRKTKIARITGLLLLTISLASAAHAQNLYGFTSLDYDEVDNLVVADCETVVDYSAGEYYTVYVSCEIDDDSNNQVAYGSASDTSDIGGVDVEIEAAADFGITYTATSTHKGDVYFYSWDSNCGYGRTCYTFYDYFNLLSFGGQNVDAQNYWDFFMPGPEQEEYDQRLRAGNTYQQSTTPCSNSFVIHADAAELQCTGNTESAISSITDNHNSNFKATSVFVEPPNTINITGTIFTDPPIGYVSGPRSAKTFIHTSNPGTILWNYVVSCGKNGQVTQTVQGGQSILCPGP